MGGGGAAGGGGGGVDVVGGGGACTAADVVILIEGSRGTTSFASSGCLRETASRNSIWSSFRTASLSMSACCFSFRRRRISATSSDPGAGVVDTRAATSPGATSAGFAGADLRGATGAEAQRVVPDLPFPRRR